MKQPLLAQSQSSAPLPLGRSLAPMRRQLLQSATARVARSPELNAAPPAIVASGHSFANLSLDAPERSPQPVMPAQRQEGLSDPQAPSVNRPTRSHQTGLPDRLKTGIEALSGMAMDDVRVHFNSPKPAQIQALAYTQGTQIHIAPGQTQHLAHEAWHVVQQRQGRVKPTLQAQLGTMAVAMNDDVTLEQEADAMATQALQGATAVTQLGDRHQPLASQLISASRVIQRVSSLTETSADGPLDSPFTILQAELPGVNLFLSSVNTTNTLDPSATQAQYKRPQQVDAVIQGPRRPTGGRPPSGMPASVGNLGNQELLIRNGIRQQTFEGGHLIGDELLPTTIDSMVDWNLAPQNNNFNHPVYFGLAEELIFAGPTNASTGLPDRTIPVSVEVKLAYPASTFSVTVQDLINNSVIAATDPSLTGISLTKTITFPNRVPNKWDIVAKVPNTSTATFSRHQLTTNQQSAFNSSNDLSTPLSQTDFLVSSPDLQTVNGNPMIGGGNQLRLLGRQGDTAPSNTNASRSGGVPTISAPVFVPSPLFSGVGMDINHDITASNGQLSTNTLNILGAIPGVASTHIKSVNAAVKNRFKLRLSQGIKKIHKGKKSKYKIFDSQVDWLSIISKALPNTPASRVLINRLRLDRSIKY